MNIKIWLKEKLNKPLTKEEQQAKMVALTNTLEKVKAQRRALAKEMGNG